MSENANTRPGSGQEMKDGRKRCFRHLELFPNEDVWRELDEFWTKDGVSTGLQSRCKRCCKSLKHSKRASSERIRRSRVPMKESVEIHARVHRDTKKMLDRLREREQRSLSAIVDDACEQYALNQILQGATNE